MIKKKKFLSNNKPVRKYVHFQIDSSLLLSKTSGGVKDISRNYRSDYLLQNTEKVIVYIGEESTAELCRTPRVQQ